MESIGARFKQLRSQLHLNQKEFVIPLNISQGNLSEIENDAYQPSAETIISVIRYYKISANWILLGIGNMFINEEDFIQNEFTKKEIDFIQLLRKLSPDDRLKIEGMVEMKLLDKEIGSTYVTENDENAASLLLHEPHTTYSTMKRGKIEKRGSSSMVFNSTKIAPSKINA